MLDVPAPENTTSKRTTSDVQVKNWIGVGPVVFKRGHRQTLAEVAASVRSAVNSSADFPDPASDVPIV